LAPRFFKEREDGAEQNPIPDSPVLTPAVSAGISGIPAPEFRPDLTTKL
jgi:hypothetical protein